MAASRKQCQDRLDKNLRTVRDIEHILGRRFFTWTTYIEYKIDKIQGVAHYVIYEAFKSCKAVGVGSNYSKNDNLPIFSNEGYLKSNDDKEILFET
jgi:hypothetical protein